jgi:eukaryotic-like serine/threonine-protein kinase
MTSIMSDAAPDLLIRLLIDQSERWTRGQPVPVETYLQQHPTLQNDDEQLLDLISNEIFVRQGLGLTPTIEDYRERFPRLSEQIELQFQLHQATGAKGVGGPKTTPTLPEQCSPVELLPAIPGYELLEAIGRGAMGVVYRARQTSLRRVVALKVLSAGGKSRFNQQARFRFEAEAVARLQHTNIVQIFEVGEHEGCSYFSLELVEGGTLAQRQKSAPLSFVEAARCVMTLARAMHYAHQRGVIHRDLKPANVLMTKDGAPKITDFGLAKQLSSTRRLTQVGDVLGTPNYMAPEQAWGQQTVTEAADIYALGAILYELLTGQPPFRGDTAFATLLMVGTEDPPAPSAVRPRVPADLNAICLKCLRKEPQQRYATAAALADDLQRYLEDRPVTVRPLGDATRLFKWARRSPARAALTLALIFAALGLSAQALQQGLRIKRERERIDEDFARLTGEATAARDETASVQAQRNAQAIAADQALEAQRNAAKEQIRAIEKERDAAREEAARLGLRLSESTLPKAPVGVANQQREVLARLDRLQRELYALQLLGAAAALPYDPDRARQMLRNEARCPPNLQDYTWNLQTAAAERTRAIVEERKRPIKAIVSSPDGGALAIVGDDGLVTVRGAETGLLLCELKGHPANLVAFGPNGKLATAGADAKVRLWDSKSSSVAPPPTGKAHAGAIQALAFGPTGKLAVASQEPVAPKKKDKSEKRLKAVVRIWGPDLEKEIAEAKTDVGAIHALAYGEGKIVSAGEDGFLLTWDDKKLGGNGVRKAHDGPIHALAFSADGKSLASAGKDGVLIWDYALAAIRVVLSKQQTGANAALAISGDGRMLATAAEETSGRDETGWPVKLWDTSTGRLLASFSCQARVTSLAFVLGGKRLAVASGSRVETWQLTSPLEQTTINIKNATTSSLAVAPTGGLVACGVDKTIDVRDTTTNYEKTLKGHTGPVNALAFKPGGGVLASGAADGTLRLWSVPDGGERKAIEAHVGGLTCLAYSRGGAFLASGGKDQRVKLWNQTGETIATLKASADVVSIAFAPDEQVLAVASSDGGLKLWRHGTNDVRSLQVTGDALLSLAFLSNAALAAGGEGGALSVWDVAGKITAKLAGQRGDVRFLQLSPDSRTLAACGSGELRLLDPVTGQLRGTLSGHGKAIVGVGFSADSRALVAAYADGTIKVWR